jgi:hypothetical protein
MNPVGALVLKIEIFIKNKWITNNDLTFAVQIAPHDITRRLPQTVSGKPSSSSVGDPIYQPLQRPLSPMWDARQR